MDKTKEFRPQLHILPSSQRQLWDELASVPDEFVLYGGTAIALHLGHRQSVDFDFFGKRPFDPTQLAERLPFLAGAEVIQREANTLTAVVERGGPVQLTFLGVPSIVQIAPPYRAPGNGLQVASLLDLAGTKVSVVQVRAEAKDYVDIDALIGQGGIDLLTALAAGGAIYGRQFNPQITLKALSFFDDGNLGQLPDLLKQRLAAAAREVDLDRLPYLGSAVSNIGIASLGLDLDRKTPDRGAIDIEPDL